MSQKKTPTKKKQSPHKKTRARTRAPLPKPERGKPGTRSHKAPRVPSVPPPSPSEGARKVALLAAQAGLDKKAAGIESGSKTPGRALAGKVTTKQLEEIAKQKMKDLNANDIEGAVKQLAGSARSMGLEVVE